MAEHVPVIIVGAGPGGLQLAYFLERSGVPYLLLDRASGAGSFFSRLPVHRRLISINKVHVGEHNQEKALRWDWNSLLCDQPALRFANYSTDYYPPADAMHAYLRDFCSSNALRARFDRTVTRVDRNGRSFEVHCGSESLTCDYLVMATGLSRFYQPDIPGAQLAERYVDYDASPAGFRNKRVLIIGKGNAAFETAESLVPFCAGIHLISPRLLRLAISTHFPGDVRAVNDTVLETFFLKQQNAVLNGTVKAIRKQGDVFRVAVQYTEDSEEVTLEYDRVICCTGFAMDTTVFGGECIPALCNDDRLPALTPEWESTNVRNLFFGGSLMQSNDRKSSTPFVAGIRHNAEVLARTLARRTGGSHASPRVIPGHAEELFETIYERLSQATSLWHLYENLFDVYEWNAHTRSFSLHLDVPVRQLNEGPGLATLTGLAFCFTFQNPVGEEAQYFARNGFLHPRVLWYANGEVVRDCHIREDIYADWRERDFFGAPLRQMIDAFLTCDGQPVTDERAVRAALAGNAA